MIPELPTQKVSTWLESAIEYAINGKEPEFLLRDILQDSLYYPACGLNGTPVKYLTGNIHSFIYADYMVTKKEFLKNLNGTDEGCGFKGYRSLFQREIKREEIVPYNWSSAILPLFLFHQRIQNIESRCEAFGHWSIWLKEEGTYSDDPLRAFSFLFFAGEMSAIYQGLYCRLSIAPTVLSIIQPGALGGEWERVDCDESFFKEVVASNSADFPPYLLYGGLGYRRGPQPPYQEPCWSNYGGEMIARLPERYAGLWKLKNTSSSEE
jgi:hypothetical protein